MIEQPRKHVIGNLLGIVGAVFDFGQTGEFELSDTRHRRTRV